MNIKENKIRILKIYVFEIAVYFPNLVMFVLLNTRASMGHV
jgi:hypothetical protein